MAAPALRIVDDGDAVRIGRRRVELDRYPALRRVLLALVEARAERRPLRTAELLARGWPGERVAAKAGANRVYVALSTLRRLGLGDRIARGPDGYRLEGEVQLEQATGGHRRGGGTASPDV